MDRKCTKNRPTRVRNKRYHVLGVQSQDKIVVKHKEYLISDKNIAININLQEVVW